MVKSEWLRNILFWSIDHSTQWRRLAAQWYEWSLQACLPVYWLLLSILALPHLLCLQGETSLPPPSPAFTYQVQKWHWKKRLGKNAQKYWVILRNTQRSQLGLVDLGSHERQACLDGGGLARAGNRGQSCNGGGTHVLNISIIDQIFSSQNFVLAGFPLSLLSGLPEEGQGVATQGLFPGSCQDQAAC